MLMSCFDIHTHQIPLSSTDRAVYACTMQDVAGAGEVQYRSVGIHPWYLTEANAEEQLQWLYQAVKLLLSGVTNAENMQAHQNHVLKNSRKDKICKHIHIRQKEPVPV